MSDLATVNRSAAVRARQRFPDHSVEVVYPVCLPIYELRLRMTVMTSHDLTTTARFILQLSNLRSMPPDEISKLLGLPSEFVKSAAVELLSGELIEQRVDLGLSITEKGREILAKGGRSIRPGNMHLRIPFDPLTRRSADIGLDRLLDRDVVRKNGDYIVPTSPKRPRLSAIRMEEVRNYERVFGRSRSNLEILEIAAIKDIKLRYRNDVLLVKLNTPDSNVPTFAAYQSRQYLEHVSAGLQRLADRGVDLVPDEYKSFNSQIQMGATGTSKEESSLLTSIQEVNQAYVKSDLAVDEVKELHGSTQNDVERKALANRIVELEAERNTLASKLDELETQLGVLTRGATRLIKTEDHRPLLIEAIQKARTELTLVSAWINSRTLDDELCRFLVQAIKRGVNVRIAWGLGTGKSAYKRGSGASRNQIKANEALSRLKQLIPTRNRKQLAIIRTETHEKFIICDDLFCAAGSFNWLSYRGEIDDGYRRETSYYSERKGDIELWEKNAATIFRS